MPLTPAPLSWGCRERSLRLGCRHSTGGPISLTVRCVCRVRLRFTLFVVVDVVTGRGVVVCDFVEVAIDIPRLI